MSNLNVLSQFEKVNTLLHSHDASKYRNTKYLSYDSLFNTLYNPINLHLDSESGKLINKYNQAIREAYQKYFFSFSLCTSYVSRSPNVISHFRTQDYGSKYAYSSLKTNMGLRTSPIYSYIFPKKAPKSVKSAHPVYIKDKRYYMGDTVSYIENLNNYYYDKLYNVSCALRRCIRNCPYTRYIELSQNSPDIIPIHSTFVTLLTPFMRGVFQHITPLEFLDDYFSRMESIRKNNENFTPAKIRCFYRGYYKELARLISNNRNSSQTLLDYFISECLLNGTFIFYCIDTFSSSSAVNMLKETPYIAPALFDTLNDIDNFFLRRVLLDFFMESYYTPYSYNDTQYESGKASPKKWLDNITKQIIPDFMANTQKTLYPFCCGALALSLPIKEIDTICQYFNISYMTDSQTHRTKTAEKLTLKFTELQYHKFLASSGHLKLPLISDHDDNHDDDLDE